jgi:hypothetical protein
MSRVKEVDVRYRLQWEPVPDPDVPGKMIGFDSEVTLHGRSFFYRIRCDSTSSGDAAKQHPPVRQIYHLSESDVELGVDPDERFETVREAKLYAELEDVRDGLMTLLA